MLELKVEKRTILGKKAKSLRKKGFLPAVVYGPKVKSVPVAVAYSDFEKIWKKAGESTLVSLHLEGSPKSKGTNVLIHEVLHHPLSGQPLHVDFYAVEMTKAVTAKIPLHFEGESPAVKDLGGVLVKTLHELEVEALPMDLPHEFVIDVSVLGNLEDKIKVKDVYQSPKVKILADPEEIVVLVESPRVEAEVAPVEVPSEAEAIEQIKVATEKKKMAEEGSGTSGEK